MLAYKKLQLEISTAATYVGMVMWEWCCVITATLYRYFVDQCHLYILLVLMKSFLYYIITHVEASHTSIPVMYSGIVICYYYKYGIRKM